jgi:ACS family D-galactonate transporter-like MFS transporter
MGGSTFIIFMTGFVGELVGGYVADKWKAAGGKPNLVMRVVFVVAGLITALGILLANRVTSATSVVVLLSVALFFLRWFGMYWCLPGLLGGQSRVGLMAASMNLFGQIMGIAVPLIVGLIVQVTHSYNYAMIFFGMAAIGLALFSSLIDYRERGVA